MTLLDDEIDLLRRFRADEAVLDDAARARMWARICADVPDARQALDALAPHPEVRRPRPRRPEARVLVAVAALVLVLAAGVVALGSRTDEEPVTAERPTADPTSPEPSLADLDDLAAEVADGRGTVLGSSAGARYAHQVLVRTTETAVSAPVERTEERWIDLDGTGRLVITGRGVAGRDETVDQPGGLRLGLLAPEVAVGLADDADGVLAAIEAQRGVPTVPGDVSRLLVETLAFPGLPGPARAGLLRVLDRWGFDPVPTPGLGPNLWRVEGPGPDGSVVQADVDLLSGQVVASRLSGRDGYLDVRRVTVADLRADTRGP